MADKIEPKCRVQVIDGISEGRTGTVVKEAPKATQANIVMWEVKLDDYRTRNIREDFLKRIEG